MTYNMNDYNQYGDTIKWFNFELGKIHGWKEGLKINDKILSNMQSGNVAKFKIISINYMSNPSDQFFANVEFIDYLNNKEPSDDNEEYMTSSS